MTAKEKAKKLIEQFKFTKLSVISSNPKVCALICVDEMFSARLNEIEKVSEYVPCEIYSQQLIFIQREWKEVKQEIIKL